jgi:DNA-binding NarL/FixJ family response regulator
MPTKINLSRKLRLGPAAYTKTYQQGMAADPAAVFAAALGEPYQPDPDTPTTRPWNALTPAEQDVARLAAQGLSNATIAVRRNVSLRTVETQMTAILRELGIKNRHQIIGMIPATDTTGAGCASAQP